jgi:NAD(P)-dependent dehydrogenase (short-subunit alcohol dehydrogenase family)
MDTSSHLTGKIAVITGSTRGMGAGIARRLATDGAVVVVSGRNVEAGKQVTCEIQENGGQALFVRADVASEIDCVTLIRTVKEQLGRLDILVNNSAITPVEPPGKQSVELWDQVFDINVRGAFLCCREAIPIMRAQGAGRIINIGSTVPFRGKMDRLAYGCSKGALYFMTKIMARDLVRDRILVNWVSVGWVATPGEIDLRNQLHGDGAAYLRETEQNTPLGRLETVEEIAAGVAYLASEQASHITGCDLNISGGLWIGS